MLANRWPKQYGPRSPGNPKPLPRTASIGRTVGHTPNSDKRAEARNIAFDWMRSVLQNQLALSALRNDLGELPELGELLRRLYEGRLSPLGALQTPGTWRGHVGLTWAGVPIPA